MSQHLNIGEVYDSQRANVSTTLLIYYAPHQRGFKILGLSPTNFDNPFPANEHIRARQGTELDFLEGEIGETVENLCPSAIASPSNTIINITNLSQDSGQLGLGRIGGRCDQMRKGDRDVVKYDILRNRSLREKS